LNSSVPTPRLIATDLDGTLLRSDLTLSSFTRRVLREIESHAVPVLFVTARPPRWMGPLRNAVGNYGRAICLNGACIYDFSTGLSSSVRGFDHDGLAQLIADIRAQIPDVSFAAERPSGAIFDPEFITEHPYGSESFIARVEDARDDVVGKLLARAPSLADTEFFRIVDDVVGSRAHLAYSGASGLAELTAPGVTKASALARWTADHGIAPQEVWAFGDMPNDIPMLQWAGHGVAVGNAHPDALAVANHIAPSNDDDGVAVVLNELLKTL